MPEKMRKVKVRTHLLQGPKKTDLAVTDEIIAKAAKCMYQYHMQRLPQVKKGSCTFAKTIKGYGYKGNLLRPRNLPDIATSLRLSILRHNWNEAAHLLQFLVEAGISRYTSLIIRACFLLLFNHPKASHEVLQNFTSKCTGYKLPEETRLFVQLLFAIRKHQFVKPSVGKYLRKEMPYKMIDEMRYNNKDVLDVYETNPRLLL